MLESVTWHANDPKFNSKYQDDDSYDDDNKDRYILIAG